MSTTPWTIRALRRQDATGVYDVLAEYINTDSLGDSYTIPFDQLCADETPHAAFVATVDETIVGVAVAYVVDELSTVQQKLNGDSIPTTDTLDPEGTISRAGYLATGYVAPAWTGQGLGRQLLERREQHCRAQNCDAIFCEVWLYDADRDARGLLDAAGYTVVYEDRTDYWGVTTDDSTPSCSICGDDCTCGGQVRRKLL